MMETVTMKQPWIQFDKAYNSAKHFVDQNKTNQNKIMKYFISNATLAA